MGESSGLNKTLGIIIVIITKSNFIIAYKFIFFKGLKLNRYS